MDFGKVVTGRRSVRAFKPDPVPRPVLEAILRTALRAPSWGNTQPWEVAILGPGAVKALGEEFVRRSLAGEPGKPDLEMPAEWPEPQKARYGELGRSLFTAMGIDRGDKRARGEHYTNMYRFFGAPNAVYLSLDARLNPYYGTLDLGALAYGICLAAYEAGVGTCTLAASCVYPDVIREKLGIPAGKRIVAGIALGYPDPEHPSARLLSHRDEGVIRWHGV